jgi:hypothetical protein
MKFRRLTGKNTNLTTGIYAWGSVSGLTTGIYAWGSVSSFHMPL